MSKYREICQLPSKCHGNGIQHKTKPKKEKTENTAVGYAMIGDARAAARLGMTLNEYTEMESTGGYTDSASVLQV